MANDRLNTPADAAARVTATVLRLRSRHGRRAPFARWGEKIDQLSEKVTTYCRPDLPGVAAGCSVADVTSGMLTYSGIMTALFDRERTGQCAHVDISMLEGHDDAANRMRLRIHRDRQGAEAKGERPPCDEAIHYPGEYCGRRLCTTRSFDFFTVPTLTFQVLYCFFVIEHARRRVLHYNSTRHPTADWVVQQLREAFPEAGPYRYAILDHDVNVLEFLRATCIEPMLTSIQAPWQNGIAERWVGSCRRELLDHAIALNEKHLRRLIQDYVNYHHEDRIHDSLQEDSPNRRVVEKKPSLNANVISSARSADMTYLCDLCSKPAYMLLNPATDCIAEGEYRRLFGGRQPVSPYHLK